MKYLYILIFISTFISCEYTETTPEKFKVSGRIININNPTKYDGKYMQIYGKYGTFKKIQECLVLDSGKYEFEYSRIDDYYIELKFEDFKDFRKTIVSNKDIVFDIYSPDSCLISIDFISQNPINVNETLYVSYRDLDNIKILGPLTNRYNLTIRTLKYDLINITYGRGYNDFIKNKYYLYKPVYPIGDPQVDSVSIQY